MVVVTDAGVQPGTVVVHFEDAALTNAAMMRARGFGTPAMFANVDRP